MTAPQRTPRRMPRWSDFAPLISLDKPDLNPTRRRLARALTIEDLRSIARRRSPRSVFDYTDGAASAEISLGRARSLFADLQFNPSVLRDVSQVDTSTTILGTRSEQPFAFAPTGFTRLMHHEGERAVAPHVKLEPFPRPWCGGRNVFNRRRPHRGQRVRHAVPLGDPRDRAFALVVHEPGESGRGERERLLGARAENCG